MKVKTAYVLRIAFIFLIGCQIANAQDEEKSLSKVDADVAKVKLNLTYEYQFMNKDSSEGIEKSFKNGKPHTEIYFKDRGQFQYVKVFNPKTGNLLKSDTILNFKKRVGSSITYFPSGKIKEIEHRDTSGQVDGYRGFFENGSKRISIGYKDGKRNGMFTEYNANGTLKETGPYVNDQRDGTFKFYDVRGALLATKKFKQGKIAK